MKTLWNTARSAKRWAEGKENQGPGASDGEKAQAAMALPKKKETARDPVGYLINRMDGLTGSEGTGYDYVWAGNGLFVQSSNDLLNARVRVNYTRTPGLRETAERVTLEMGKIPMTMLERGIQWAASDPDQERYFAIRWDGRGYSLERPTQRGDRESVTYQAPPVNTVAEFHSHGKHAGFFSATDDADEQGFRIYGVIGRNAQGMPDIKVRVGIYGHHGDITLNDIAYQEEEEE